MRRSAVAACGATLLLGGMRTGGFAQERGPLQLTPARTAIGVFYDGMHLTVTQEVAAGTDVAVVVTGPVTDLHLRRQARVWHAFWAPAEAVTFEGMPALYALQTSSPLAALAPDSVRGRYQIGYATLRPPAGVAGDLFPELLRLKESEGLFQEGIGGLRIAPGVAGRDTVVASIRLPARAPPATYDVALYGFRDGQLVLHREGSVAIVRGSLNAFVDELAHEHRLLYGILAVGVAMGAGLLVGLAFGTVKGH